MIIKIATAATVIDCVHVEKYMRMYKSIIILLGSRGGSLMIALAPSNVAQVQFWLGAISGLNSLLILTLL